MHKDKLVIEVGYSAKQLQKKANELVLEGYRPLGPHTVIYIEDGDVWEYSLALILDDEE